MLKKKKKKCSITLLCTNEKAIKCKFIKPLQSSVEVRDHKNIFSGQPRKKKNFNQRIYRRKLFFPLECHEQALFVFLMQHHWPSEIEFNGKGRWKMRCCQYTLTWWNLIQLNHLSCFIPLGQIYFLFPSFRFSPQARASGSRLSFYSFLLLLLLNRKF